MGGKGVYFFIVLMNLIFVKVVGVEEIIMVILFDKYKSVSKYILVVVKICGVDKIYKVGGV